MKVSRAGQIVIPPSLQDESGIHPGTEVEMHHENGTIVVSPLEPDDYLRDFREKLRSLRGSLRRGEHPSAVDLTEVAGLSRGEQFVRLLADSGVGHMTTDELMEMLRGPYEDLDPR